MNTWVIPHSAFKGQTPHEMYFGLGDHVPEEVNRFIQEQRLKRMEDNRSLSCTDCLSNTELNRDNFDPAIAANDAFIDDHFP